MFETPKEHFETQRARLQADGDRSFPLFAVWEVTLRCDQPCQHCGSRAGPARDNELSTEQCLRVADELSAMGCREVVLIGGEAYLRPDIAEIVARLHQGGMRVIMQTGGRGLLKVGRLESLRRAGLSQLGVSVDGPEHVHDQLRGNKGSYAAAIAAVQRAKAMGVSVSVNSQINRLNYRLLEPFAQMLQDLGVGAWQLSFTVPMGRAADRPEWLLPPHKVVEVLDTLAAIQLGAVAQAKAGTPVFDVVAGNTIGYYGPHELVLRSRPGGTHAVWDGCQAGHNTLGIEADGTVKGCPSLPTGPYAGGNLLQQGGLLRVWNEAPEVAFNRPGASASLWGRCKTCYYAPECRGGCSWMAHTILGRRGNNPFCYHRAETLAKEGVRERLVPVAQAPNRPFDFGRFTLEEVPLDTPEREDPVLRPSSSRRHLPVLQG